MGPTRPPPPSSTPTGEEDEEAVEMLDDQDAQAVTDAATPANALSREIGVSLASVWARYVGSRPENGATEIEGNAVRWTHACGEDELAHALAGDDDRPARSATSYHRELSVAVAKATRRRVAASVSKKDTEAGTATETFILDVPPRKN